MVRKEVAARPEITFLMFSSGLMSQGFEIRNLTYDSTNAVLDLLDLTKGNPRDRGIHSSQLLGPLWAFSNSKHLEIKYYDCNGTLHLTSTIDSSIFEQMEDNEEKDMSFFAQNVQFRLESCDDTTNP
ncbi:MAG: hypothetical protein EOP48_30440 [Sphingobacteriales bacterium]|nr:MAG: hypothetical protein EOP48_30440 [Sphingobacteriales bacterium]